MPNKKKKKKTTKKPKNRFEIRHEGSSDHYMQPESTLYILDTHTNKVVKSYTSYTYEDKGSPVYKLEFSADGWEVLAKDALGRVIERIDLRKI